MRRRDKLSQVREYIKGRDPVIAFYSSKAVESFGNIRYLRLMVIHDDTVTLMPCSAVRVKSDGIQTQRVLFSERGLLRICSGDRSGMYVTHDRLRVGETASKTGLVKRLGPGNNCISISNDKDQAVIDRMYEAIQDPLDSNELLCPSYYIRSARKGDLVPRLEGHVTKAIMAQEGYDRKFPFEDNFHNLIDVFAETDPGSRKYKLYPLDYVQGPGLMMFDADTIPPAQVLPLAALRRGYELTEVDI